MLAIELFSRALARLAIVSRKGADPDPDAMCLRDTGSLLRIGRPGQGGVFRQFVEATATILLTMAMFHSANAQGTSSPEDPVARAMDRISESVDARAADARTVLAARQLVQESRAARRSGRPEDAAATMAQAINLLDQSMRKGADSLVQSYRLALLEEQPGRASESNLNHTDFAKLALSLPAVPQSVLLRFKEYRERLAPILEGESLPPQLLAVVLVESGFDRLALSPKGARGLWQFMPSTARRYGLLVIPGDDRRTQPEESTRAAARYLRDLYSRFGDWKLALAAYNAGEERVQRAIDMSGSRNFDEIAGRGYLPAETRKYVPAVLAAWARMSQPGEWGSGFTVGGRNAGEQRRKIFLLPGAGPKSDEKGEAR